MIDYEERDRLLNKALQKWGESAQIDIAIEEMAEVIQKLQHYKRGRIEKKDVVEEIVDLQIMTDQLKLIFNDYAYLAENIPDFDEWEERKLLRLENRIEND